MPDIAKHGGTLLGCNNLRGWQMTHKFTLQCHQETIIPYRPWVSVLKWINNSDVSENFSSIKPGHHFFWRKEGTTEVLLPSFMVVDSDTKEQLQGNNKSQLSISSRATTGLKDSCLSRTWRETEWTFVTMFTGFRKIRQWLEVLAETGGVQQITPLLRFLTLVSDMSKNWFYNAAVGLWCAEWFGAKPGGVRTKHEEAMLNFCCICVKQIHHIFKNILFDKFDLFFIYLYAAFPLCPYFSKSSLNILVVEFCEATQPLLPL